jgi:hypothetical protein
VVALHIQIQCDFSVHNQAAQVFKKVPLSIKTFFFWVSVASSIQHTILLGNKPLHASNFFPSPRFCFQRSLGRMIIKQPLLSIFSVLVIM